MKWIYNRFKGAKTVYYLDEPMICDTETSHNHNEKNPICWITSIQVFFNGKYFLFRKPTEFMEYLNSLIKLYRLDENRRIKVCFHNASYDLSYLIGFFQEYLPYKEDIVMLNDRHKIKAYRQGGIDIIDTYSLSSVSLETWGKNLNVEHKKKVGMYDYDKIIFQDDELTKEEQEYDKFDVLSLHECFKKQLEIYSDTVASCPFTSTGYIRRHFRRNAQKSKEYKSLFRNTRLHEDSFNICVSGFCGGYTHGNRFHQKMIKGLIGHRDFRSHYPTQLRTRPMPFGAPINTYNYNNPFDRNKKITAKEICEMYPEYFSMVVIIVTEAQIKDLNISMPFMQLSKMFNMHKEKLQLDNGRILKFKGYAELITDNLTLEILLEQYDIRGFIARVISFRTMMLPKCLATTIDEYFKSKSDEKIKLKEFEKEYGLFDDRTIEQADVLRRSKDGLNGCYGMFVQNPTHDLYDVDYDKIDERDDIYNPIINTMSTEEQLNKYYNNLNSFLVYQVGVAVTASARYELYQYIKCIGYDKVLYCDTDSIFYLKDDETEKRIEELNEYFHNRAKELNAFITDSNGKDIYYDVFEPEDDCKAFKQLHAKCYGYVYEEETEEGTEDRLKVTIAGVPSRTMIGMKKGSPVYLTREEELGLITKEMKMDDDDDSFEPYEALDRMTNDFTFYVNTGTSSNYVVCKPQRKKVKGHIVETCGGCIIKKLDSKQISDITNEDVILERLEGEQI